MSFLKTMQGPDFLVLYLVWFGLTWISMLVLRHKVSDTLLTSLSGLLAFEGLGVARFLVGSANGMHKWDFLFLMMGVGALFFVLRAENFESGSDGGSGVDSFGGGGCGGGGCGGGGCGGCGGS